MRAMPGVPSSPKRLCLYMLALAWVLGLGCAKPRLMNRPNLFRDGDGSVFAEVPEALRTADMDVLFATDRARNQDGPNGRVRFGSGRSNHLYVGHCRVKIGEIADWESLVEESLKAKRERADTLSVGEPQVYFRYPGNFWGAPRIDDPSSNYEEYQRRRLEARARLHEQLGARLAVTPRKDVFVFVHGYNNDFDDSVSRIANLWHYFGRVGVPIAYTWPAGVGGLTGYTTDSESGEFTVYHLKMFLEDVAAMPEVEHINIIAHSRGTDVTMSAIRELAIGVRGGGKDPRRELKLGNVVLASADLDLDVVGQRISSERLPQATERLTIYLSPADAALKASSWLHGSWARLGLMNVDELSKEQLAVVKGLPNLNIIDSRVKTDWLGHSYFYDNPAVSSDLILLMRDGKAMGAANGRPVKVLGENLGRIEDGYPDYGTATAGK